MISRWLLAVLWLGGCVSDDYRCTFDEQCDLGEAGRCELDGRCTAHDRDCPSARRYTEHSGAQSGTCFDDAVTPQNPCADGQRPAVREGCFAEVCDALPACCDTGWSNACVQQAQITCPDVRCDTRIAITAGDGVSTEVWDLRSSDGVTWAADRLTGTAIAWLAPAPNGSEPRLARFEPGMLVVDDASYPLTARSYTDVTSVDLERTGRDAIVLGSNDPAIPLPKFLEVLDLTTGATRELTFEVSTRVEWGDHDHDAFPDAVISSPGVVYALATSVEDPVHQRVFSQTGRAATSGQKTPGQDPEVRALAWADLDGDGNLDLIVGGSSVRVHVAGGNLMTVNDSVQVTVDCHPVATTGTANCPAGSPVGSNASSFATVAIPRPGGAEIVLAAFPQLEATSLTITNEAGVITPTLTPIAIPAAMTCGPTGCPPPIVALVARDLDHDGTLDLIGIDQQLGVWTRIAPAEELTFAFQISALTPATSVRVSVSGAPL